MRNSANTSLARKLGRYREALRNLPPSGGGGCHPALLGCANLARIAGVDPDQVMADLRKHVHGTRPVTDSEIRQATEKGYSQSSRIVVTRRATPTFPGKAAAEKIIANGKQWREEDVRGCSPVMIGGSPEGDAHELLSRLYAPTDKLFIGGRYDAFESSIRPVSAWLDEEVTQWPHIVPNPLSGELAPSKSDNGEMTYRGDHCVSAFRFATVEFDDMDREGQVAFWCGFDWPLAALIDSGGKSLHAWLALDGINGEKGWDAYVRYMYREFLVPLGADSQCANPSRLSRMPGHTREDSQRIQRLLFLDPASKGPRHYLTGGKS